VTRNDPRDVLGIIVNVVFIIVAMALLGGFVRREFFTSAAGAPLGAPQAQAVDGWQAYSEVGHRLGSPDAEVVLVEFTDFECPACRAFAMNALHALRESLGDSIAIVFRHLPLPNHRLAYPAARAAECARQQERFIEYHDALFTHQDSLGIKSFDDFARLAGVPDLETFAECVNQSGPVAAIEADLADAQALGIRATPTLLINNQMISGALNVTGLGVLLQQAFEEARSND